MADEIRARKRAKRPKVRSGCRTCKIRKVKCDEGVPRCHRCTKLGIICGGYELVTKKREKSDTSGEESPLRSLDNTLGLSDSEVHNFDWFRLKTIQSLGGFSRSTIWEALLMQVCQQEPVVMSAVIALGSTHRAYEQKHNQKDIQQFRYVKALRQLRSRLAKDPTHEIALITCFLFICLELIENNFAAVFVHLRAGLKILCEIRGKTYHKTSRVVPTTTNPTTLLDFLAAFFIHLDYQATLFGERIPRIIGQSSDNTTDSVLWLPESFSTAAEVKLYTDTLVTAVSAFKARVLHDLACPNSWLWYDKSKTHRWAHIMFRNLDVRSLDAKMQQEKEELEERLLAWDKAFTKFWKRNHLIMNLEEARMAKMAQMAWYSMLIILKETTATRQKFFDQYLEEFDRIVTLAEELTALPSFSTDLGCLGPLYYTGIKCRDSLVRNRAAKLLISFSRKEGMWDAQMLGRTVLKMIALEEHGLKPANGEYLTCDELPESSRYYEVATGGAYNMYAGRFRHEVGGSNGEWFVQEVEYASDPPMVDQGFAEITTIRELGAAVFRRPEITKEMGSSPAGPGLRSKVFDFVSVPGEAQLEYLRRVNGNPKLEAVPLTSSDWVQVPGLQYPRTFEYMPGTVA